MTSKYETREDVGKLNEQTSDFFSTNNSKPRLKVLNNTMHYYMTEC